jgi:dienelactone hydrolase
LSFLCPAVLIGWGVGGRLQVIENFRGFFLFLLLTPSGLSAQKVVIDGRLDDALWKGIEPSILRAEEIGISRIRGGEVRAVVAGRYLYLSAYLPEPDGRVVAQSIGVNPVWEGGEEARRMQYPQITFGAANGEDVVRFLLFVRNGGEWALQVGPFGAYSIAWRWTGEGEWYNGDPERSSRFLVASAMVKEAWSVEAAIPLVEIGSPAADDIRLKVERKRAERPNLPTESWVWPDDQPTGGVTLVADGDHDSPDPQFEPPSVGNTEPPIQVSYRKDIPALHTAWTDPKWRAAPVSRLLRNESAARDPQLPTEVKLIQDGNTLAVLARCIESDRDKKVWRDFGRCPEMAKCAHPGSTLVRPGSEERDDAIDQDDSFQVYLATSGSYYVQYAINRNGVILDAAGHQGNPRLSRPHTEWNSPVVGAAWNSGDAWFARLDIPLAYVARTLGQIKTSERTQVPANWRVLLMRNRPGRDGQPREVSVLPVTETRTPFCPARYRRLELVGSEPGEPERQVAKERGGNLGVVPDRVFSPEQRKQMNLSGMFDTYLYHRVLKMLEEEKSGWDKVETLSDWEHFRTVRLVALKRALGRFPEKCNLNTQIVSEYRGHGYRRQNIVFQSQPGLWVTANLYLPLEPQTQMPGIVIIHSLHAPKSQFELQDLGIIWARAGCAVLVMDQIGYGERISAYPWDESNVNSRFVTAEQLYLTGSSLMTWMVWDTMRGIDFFAERKDINQQAIIVLGAVAGGGDPAAVTAALDPRVAAVVPFNFGEAAPATARFLSSKNQWPLQLADPGLYDSDTIRVIRRAIADQFLQWFICASVAPRRFVYSFEVGWRVEDLPAWERYRKVYSLYNALGNLAEAHGFGPMPGPGECWNIGRPHRQSLDPTLERWFGIPMPFLDQTSGSNLEPEPDIDRQPTSELTVLTPEVSSKLGRKAEYQIAQQQGQSAVSAVRNKLEKMSMSDRRSWLKSMWADKLGEITPKADPHASMQWAKDIPNATVEGIGLEVEPELTLPMLLIRPHSRHGSRTPVIVALSEGGKELFLEKRKQEIEALITGGSAVCLPDVRATGELTPDGRRDPDSDESMKANTVLMMGETLLGERLRDLRSVMAYLKTRADIDSSRIGLWGDSFETANPPALLLNEMPQWQIGPQIQHHAEPLGGLLALLGALYQDEVRTIAVRGNLVSYSSILQSNFSYVPQDVIVPGILEVGDIPDIAAALAPSPMLLTGLVDGINRLVTQSELHEELQPVYEAYRTIASPADALRIHSGAESANFAEWFIKHNR